MAAAAEPGQNLMDILKNEGEKEKEALMTGNSKANYRPNTLSLPAHIHAPLPMKRMPAELDPTWDVPDELGQLMPGEVAVNGAFKNQPPTQPQKSIFLTYESSDTSNQNNKFYDCKLPLKINIPSGDSGLYSLTVNEVLFRNDATLFNTDEDWFKIELKTISQVSVTSSLTVGDITYTNTAVIPLAAAITWPPNVTPAALFQVTDKYKGLKLSYMSTTILERILNDMLANPTPNNIISNNFQIAQENIPTITTAAGVVYTAQAGTGNIQFNMNNLFKATPNHISGNGLFIQNNPTANAVNINFQHNPDAPIAGQVYITLGPDTVFTFAGSSHIKNIFPNHVNKNILTSQPYHVFMTDLANQPLRTAIKIPYLNFAGPLVFMLNSSAQTTCPIANETASQFNTCALSYNTSLTTGDLVQMNSNIPLIVKEGGEFRVWLSDILGNPVDLHSPMYIQVTVEPYSNAKYQAQ